MNVGEIVKDSLRFPFSDLKKFVVFAVIVLMSFILVKYAYYFVVLGIIFLILGFLLQILEYGYCFRIIQSSLNGSTKPPELNAWKNMFKDGFEMFVLLFVYLLPSTFIIYVSAKFPTFTYGIVLAVLYILVIFPILALELVQITNTETNTKLFDFSNILKTISDVGWNKFFKWYITTGVIVSIILALGYYIIPIIEKLSIGLLGTVLLYLIIIPYLFMYMSRSIALIFKNE